MTTTLTAESGWSQSEVAQSCPTLCDPMDCSLPGCSLHGILQARVLELGAISFSRGSSQPRDRTWVSRIPGRWCNLWATREALGLHRTIQLQLLQRYSLGNRLELLWYWMVCLGNEQRLFCRFWDCIQVLHFRIFCWPWWLHSSEGFLPTVVDIMVIWVKFTHYSPV